MARHKRQEHFTASAVEVAERRAQVVRLKLQGFTHQQIADRLGYSNRGAVSKALAAGLRAAVAEPAAELITLEAERLDALRVTLHEQIESEALDGGDGRVVIAAVAELRKVSESYRRLFGLDAPAKSEVSSDVTVVFDAALAPTPVAGVVLGELPAGSEGDDPRRPGPSLPGAPGRPIR